MMKQLQHMSQHDMAESDFGRIVLTPGIQNVAEEMTWQFFFHGELFVWKFRKTVKIVHKEVWILFLKNMFLIYEIYEYHKIPSSLLYWWWQINKI